MLVEQVGFIMCNRCPIYVNPIEPKDVMFFFLLQCNIQVEISPYNLKTMRKNLLLEFSFILKNYKTQESVTWRWFKQSDVGTRLRLETKDGPQSALFSVQNISSNFIFLSHFSVNENVDVFEPGCYP